jgi:hypothetical protein
LGGQTIKVFWLRGELRVVLPAVTPLPGKDKVYRKLVNTKLVRKEFKQTGR